MAAGAAESAVAIAEENADRVDLAVADGQIELAIAVPVARVESGGGRARRIRVWRLERAVAVAQRHHARTAGVVGRSDVQLAVAVPVARGEVDRGVAQPESG